MSEKTLKQPPFNPKAKCPKCGFSTVSTSYCKGLRLDSMQGISMFEACLDKKAKVFDGDHFHRMCSRCHYEWYEACIKPEQNVTLWEGVKEIWKEFFSLDIY